MWTSLSVLGILFKPWRLRVTVSDSGEVFLSRFRGIYVRPEHPSQTPSRLRLGDSFWKQHLPLIPPLSGTSRNPRALMSLLC